MDVSRDGCSRIFQLVNGINATCQLLFAVRSPLPEWAYRAHRGQFRALAECSTTLIAWRADDLELHVAIQFGTFPLKVLGLCDKSDALEYLCLQVRMKWSWSSTLTRA
jgi:hypothetical protein